MISVLEGDRIPPLKSHGQALEEELCFPSVLSDNRDASANLLRHFYGCFNSCHAPAISMVTRLLADQSRWQQDTWHVDFMVEMVKTGQFTTKCKGDRVIALKRQKSLWWDSA